MANNMMKIVAPIAAAGLAGLLSVGPASAMNGGDGPDMLKSNKNVQFWSQSGMIGTRPIIISQACSNNPAFMGQTTLTAMAKEFAAQEAKRRGYGGRPYEQFSDYYSQFQTNGRCAEVIVGYGSK